MKTKPFSDKVCEKWSPSVQDSRKSKNSDDEMEELLKSIVSNDDENKRQIWWFSHRKIAKETSWKVKEVKTN